MTIKEIKVLYRYELLKYRDFHDCKLYRQVWLIKKETPCGYWIEGGRWVSKTGKKRYAYPTENEALINYIKRTERRIGFLKRDLIYCEKGLATAKMLKT